MPTAGAVTWCGLPLSLLADTVSGELGQWLAFSLWLNSWRGRWRERETKKHGKCMDKYTASGKLWKCMEMHIYIFIWNVEKWIWKTNICGNVLDIFWSKICALSQTRFCAQSSKSSFNQLRKTSKPFGWFRQISALDTWHIQNTKKIECLPVESPISLTVFCGFKSPTRG